MHGASVAMLRHCPLIAQIRGLEITHSIGNSDESIVLLYYTEEHV